jgi:adenylate cyclase
MVADGGGEEAVAVRQFLERLVATAAEGRLYRDIWVASKLPEEFITAVEPYVANNLLNMHPNADSFYEARLYPLAMMLGERFRESLPLILARATRGAGRMTSAEVLEQLKTCGISAAWQEALPAGLSLQEDLRADAVPQQEYPYGDKNVPWMLFASNSPSILPVGYWVNYCRSPTDFPRMSYTEANNEAGAQQLAGKIVIVGYEATIDPSSDTYPVPNQPQRAAAAEVAACALQTLLDPQLMRAAPVWLGCSTVLGMSLLAALSGGLLKPLRAAGVVFAILITWFALTVLAYRAGWFADVTLTPLATVLAAGLGAGHRYLGEIRWRLRIVDLFGRYVPRAVVTQLVQQPDVEALALGGVKRDVTVLFADIRGFTPFAERHPPEEVIEQLNSLLRRVRSTNSSATRSWSCSTLPWIRAIIPNELRGPPKRCNRELPNMPAD